MLSVREAERIARVNEEGGYCRRGGKRYPTVEMRICRELEP